MLPPLRRRQKHERSRAARLPQMRKPQLRPPQLILMWLPSSGGRALTATAASRTATHLSQWTLTS